MEASVEDDHTPASGASSDGGSSPSCCPFYHEAVELIGRRWTGAIVDVLLQRPALRFSEIANAVPQLSDRLLSERMKELEARGLVERAVHAGPPVRVEYSLTQMGYALAPALGELKHWAQRWLGEGDGARTADGFALRSVRAS
jgi:DNA-binding HxlR family transcriptional regulator